MWCRAGRRNIIKESLECRQRYNYGNSRRHTTMEQKVKARGVKRRQTRDKRYERQERTALAKTKEKV